MAGEAERVAALRAADILYSEREASFNLLARFAAKTCGVPIAVINFIDVDRQWTKAECGLTGSATETPLDSAFCARTIREGGLFEIRDTLLDPRFAQNPLVTGEPFIRFYAGAPVLTQDGHALGALCVIDRKPGALDERQKTDLLGLAALVAELVSMRAIMRDASRSNARAFSGALAKAEVPLVILRQPADRSQRPRCSFVNEAFEAQFGITAAQVVGRSPMALMSGVLTDRRAVAELFAPEFRDVPVRREIVLYGGDGAAHLVDLHRRPLANEDGTITSWVTSLRDITTQRAAEEELGRHAERMHALYGIANARGMADAARIDAAIELGLRSFGLEHGFAVRCDDEYATVVNVARSDGWLAKVGDVLPMGGLRLRQTFLSGDVRTFDDLQDWPTYIVAPIAIGDERFGAIGFVGRTARALPFSAADREFAHLIGSFVGPFVNRSAHAEASRR